MEEGIRFVKIPVKQFYRFVSCEHGGDLEYVVTWCNLSVTEVISTACRFIVTWLNAVSNNRALEIAPKVAAFYLSNALTGRIL